MSQDFNAGLFSDVLQKILELYEPMKCCICMELYKNPVTLKCRHTFCDLCLNQVDGNTCPLCRKVSNRRDKRLNLAAGNLCEFITQVSGQMMKLTGIDVFQHPNAMEVIRNGLMETSKEPTQVSREPFDVLLSQSRKEGVLKTPARCYKNKTKNRVDARHEFENEETRKKVVEWLADSQNHFNRITQTQQGSNSEGYHTSVSQHGYYDKLEEAKRRRKELRTFGSFGQRCRSLDVRITKKTCGMRPKRMSISCDSPELEDHNLERPADVQKEVELVQKIDFKDLKEKSKERSKQVVEDETVATKGDPAGWGIVKKLNEDKRGKKRRTMKPLKISKVSCSSEKVCEDNHNSSNKEKDFSPREKLKTSEKKNRRDKAKSPVEKLRKSKGVNRRDKPTNPMEKLGTSKEANLKDKTKNPVMKLTAGEGTSKHAVTDIAAVENATQKRNKSIEKPGDCNSNLDPAIMLANPKISKDTFIVTAVEENATTETFLKSQAYEKGELEKIAVFSPPKSKTNNQEINKKAETSMDSDDDIFIPPTQKAQPKEINYMSQKIDRIQGILMNNSFATTASDCRTLREQIEQVQKYLESLEESFPSKGKNSGDSNENRLDNNFILRSQNGEDEIVHSLSPATSISNSSALRKKNVDAGKQIGVRRSRNILGKSRNVSNLANSEKSHDNHSGKRGSLQQINVDLINSQVQDIITPLCKTEGHEEKEVMAIIDIVRNGELIKVPIRIHEVLQVAHQVLSKSNDWKSRSLMKETAKSVLNVVGKTSNCFFNNGDKLRCNKKRADGCADKTILLNNEEELGDGVNSVSQGVQTDEKLCRNVCVETDAKLLISQNLQTELISMRDEAVQLELEMKHRVTQTEKIHCYEATMQTVLETREAGVQFEMTYAEIATQTNVEINSKSTKDVHVQTDAEAKLSKDTQTIVGVTKEISVQTDCDASLELTASFDDLDFETQNVLKGLEGDSEQTLSQILSGLQRPYSLTIRKTYSAPTGNVSLCFDQTSKKESNQRMIGTTNVSFGEGTDFNRTFPESNTGKKKCKENVEILKKGNFRKRSIGSDNENINQNIICNNNQGSNCRSNSDVSTVMRNASSENILKRPNILDYAENEYSSLKVLNSEPLDCDEKKPPSQNKSSGSSKNTIGNESSSDFNKNERSSPTIRNKYFDFNKNKRTSLKIRNKSVDGILDCNSNKKSSVFQNKSVDDAFFRRHKNERSPRESLSIIFEDEERKQPSLSTSGCKTRANNLHPKKSSDDTSLFNVSYPFRESLTPKEDLSSKSIPKRFSAPTKNTKENTILNFNSIKKASPPNEKLPGVKIKSVIPLDVEVVSSNKSTGDLIISLDGKEDKPKYKRIREMEDSDSETEARKKYKKMDNRFLRDDISIVFDTESQNILDDVSSFGSTGINMEFIDQIQNRIINEGNRKKFKDEFSQKSENSFTGGGSKRKQDINLADMFGSLAVKPKRISPREIYPGRESPGKTTQGVRDIFFGNTTPNIFSKKVSQDEVVCVSSQELGSNRCSIETLIENELLNDSFGDVVDSEVIESEKVIKTSLGKDIFDLRSETLPKINPREIGSKVTFDSSDLASSDDEVFVSNVPKPGEINVLQNVVLHNRLKTEDSKSDTEINRVDESETNRATVVVDSDEDMFEKDVDVIEDTPKRVEVNVARTANSRKALFPVESEGEEDEESDDNPIPPPTQFQDTVPEDGNIFKDENVENKESVSCEVHNRSGIGENRSRNVNQSRVLLESHNKNKDDNRNEASDEIFYRSRDVYRKEASYESYNRSNMFDDDEVLFETCNKSRNTNESGTLYEKQNQSKIFDRIEALCQKHNRSKSTEEKETDSGTSTQNLNGTDSAQLSLSPITKEFARNSIELPHSLGIPGTKKKSSSTPQSQRQMSLKRFMCRSKSARERAEDLFLNKLTQKKKPCIACTRLNKEQLLKISALSSRKLATYNPVFDSNVTHMIVNTDENNCVDFHTVKFVKAVAAGIWVLNFEWVLDSLASDALQPEEKYEVLDLSGVDGPRQSRLHSKTTKLFKNVRFYFAPPFTRSSQADLENLVITLGGKVVKTPEELLPKNGDVCLIIIEITSTRDITQYESWLENYGVITVDLEWIGSCVGQFKLTSVRNYTPSSNHSLANLGYPSELTATAPCTWTQD